MKKAQKAPQSSSDTALKVRMCNFSLKFSHFTSFPTRFRERIENSLFSLTKFQPMCFCFCLLLGKGKQSFVGQC